MTSNKKSKWFLNADTSGNTLQIHEWLDGHENIDFYINLNKESK